MYGLKRIPPFLLYYSFPNLILVHEKKVLLDDSGDDKKARIRKTIDQDLKEVQANYSRRGNKSYNNKTPKCKTNN